MNTLAARDSLFSQLHSDVLKQVGFASLQLEACECPFERLGHVIALRHEGLGALAQMLDG